MLHILPLFGLEHGRERPDIFIPGSPERCITRSVAQDGSGALWLVERIGPDQRTRREAIAADLKVLEDAGMDGLPCYLSTPDGSWVAEREDGLWQVSPFVEGDRLPQPAYIEDGERGEALAGFLARMRRSAASARLSRTRPDLDLPRYVKTLCETIFQREPGVHKRLKPVLGSLAGLFEALPDLPRGFSHGDLHPINVIWRGTGVASVIDWEFCGPKPETYDMANLLGCVGMEDPNCLVRGLCAEFLARARDMIAPESLAWLPDLVAAQRFAWLSEWLRKNDREMLDMELAYLDILTAHRDGLRKAWGIAAPRS